MGNVIKVCKQIRDCNAVMKSDDVVHNYLQADIASDASLDETQK